MRETRTSGEHRDVAIGVEPYDADPREQQVARTIYEERWGPLPADQRFTIQGTALQEARDRIAVADLHGMPPVEALIDAWARHVAAEYGVQTLNAIGHARQGVAAHVAKAIADYAAREPARMALDTVDGAPAGQWFADRERAVWDAAVQATADAIFGPRGAPRADVDQGVGWSVPKYPGPAAITQERA